MSTPHYLALGDSMTIDLYPGQDAYERWGIQARGLGAGSLLHRNDDELFPEFRGRDLRTLRPELAFLDLSSDGATIDTVLERQLGRAAELGGDVAVATLTVGGNDLLLSLSRDRQAVLAAVRRVQADYRALVPRLRAAMPRAELVLTTVYDPTDGTGCLPPHPERLPIELLKEANETIREVAEATDGARLADAHIAFMGHGVTVAPEDRWYWPRMIIEPSARGASELRRLWLEALGFRA